MAYNDPPKSTTSGVWLSEVISPGDATPRALKGGPETTDANGNILAPALMAGDYAEQASLAAGALNADLIPSTDVSAYKAVGLAITGTWSGTLTIQASNDNFVSAPNTVNAFSMLSFTLSGTWTANDFLHIPISFRYLRVRMTSYSSGTANGTAELYTLPFPFFLYAAQLGTWTVQPGNTANTTPWLTSPGNVVDVTALASAGRTTTQTVDNQPNKAGGKGIRVTLDMTNVGTGSVTLTINAKDAVSGKTKLLLAGAAVTTNVTNVYIVYPGYTVVANASANDVLSATFQLVVTANNANSAVYSLGYCILF